MPKDNVNGDIRKNVIQLLIKSEYVKDEIEHIKKEIRDYKHWAEQAKDDLIKNMSSTKIRADINTSLILVIIVALIGLGIKVLN